MLFAGVTSHKRGAVLSAGLVGAQHFFGKRLLEIDQEVLVKLEVTHVVKKRVMI